MPGRPDLTGAEVTDLRFAAPDLEFWLEGVRWLGLVLVGPLRLEGMRQAATREPRHAPDAYPVRAPLTIRQAAWGPDRLELQGWEPTGPGEADQPTYLLRFTRVTHALQPGLGRSLRAWAGFYPMSGDRGRHYAGSASVPVSVLNAAAVQAWAGP